jgi:hypothetical protein
VWKRAHVPGAFFFEARLWGARAWTPAAAGAGVFWRACSRALGAAATTAAPGAPLGSGQRSGRRRVSRPATTHTGTQPAATSSAGAVRAGEAATLASALDAAPTLDTAGELAAGADDDAGDDGVTACRIMAERA